MKVSVMEKVEKDISVIALHIKIRDEFCCTFQDAAGFHMGHYEGYVPDFFPGNHYGDYLILNIDVETGMILNWMKPTTKELEKILDK